MTTNVFNIVATANTADITVMYNNQFFESYSGETALSVHEQLADKYGLAGYVWQLNGEVLNTTPKQEQPIIMMTEPMREAIHPDLTSELFEKPEFTMETVNELLTIEHIDESTGEVLTEPLPKTEDTPQPINNNKPLEEVKTETKGPAVEATAQPQAEQSTAKVSLPRKALKLSTKSLGFGVRTVGTVAHFSLQSGADILQWSADRVAQLEVLCIDKLGVLPTHIELEDGSFIPLTREIAELSIKVRTKVLQSYALMPIEAGKMLIKSRKTEDTVTPATA